MVPIKISTLFKSIFLYFLAEIRYQITKFVALILFLQITRFLYFLRFFFTFEATKYEVLGWPYVQHKSLSDLCLHKYYLTFWRQKRLARTAESS